MPSAVPIQPSFARGEISPRLWSRVDLAFYQIALEQCENFVVLPHGGAARLPGSRFVSEVKFNNIKTRLLPFQFNTEQTYVIEAGNQYFRFYKDRGIVYVNATDGVIVNGNFDTDLSGWTAASVTWSAGKASFGAGGTLQQSFTVTDPTNELVLGFETESLGATLKLKVGSTAGGADILEEQTFEAGNHTIQFTPGAGKTTVHLTFTQAANTPLLDAVVLLSDQPVEVRTPWSGTTIFPTHHTQSNDVMYFAHYLVFPYKLERFGHASWSLKPIEFEGQPPEWKAENWPQRVGFFEDRLIWAAPPAQPQTLWLSSTENLQKLTIPPSPTDADAMKFTISAGQVNAIQWLAEDQQLQIGTTGATRTLAGAGIDAPLTPTSVKGKRHTTFGAAPIQPIQTGEITIYAGQYGRKIREFVFSFDRDRFVSPDLSLLSEHLTRPGIAEMAYQQDPDSIIWMARTDGQLVGLTYERDQEVAAFHRHKIAGGKADQWGEVESVTVISGTTRDEVWLCVKRTIDGQTKRYVEFLEFMPEPEDNVDKEDLFFVHSGLSYDGRNQTVALTLSAVTGKGITITAASDRWSANNVGDKVISGNGRAVITAYTSPTVVTADVEKDFSSTAIPAGWTLAANSVGGLGHLEAEDVAILADGAVMPQQTVSAGRVTLPDARAAGRWQVGLNYRSSLRTLRPEAGAADGTAQGRLKLIHRIVLRLRETLGLKFGRSLDDLDIIPFRKTGQPMDESPPLFTGDKEVALTQGWGPDAQIWAVQDQPLPAEIQAVIPKMQTTEN